VILPTSTSGGSGGSSATNAPMRYVAPGSSEKSPRLTGVTLSSSEGAGGTCTGPGSVTRATATEAPANVEMRHESAAGSQE
jgi:hypothetical protein